MNKIDEASKFSPLTARLMVRKGEANQTAELGWTLKPSLFAKKGAAKPASVANDAPKSRRLVLTMTPREYETLGLIAVKKGTTRHQLAQEALAVYFDTLADEMGGGCLCIEACSRGCD
jgi:hypothetical protein